MTQLTAATKTRRRGHKIACLACHRSEIGLCPQHLEEANAAQEDKMRAALYAVGWCFTIALLTVLAALVRC